MQLPFLNDTPAQRPQYGLSVSTWAFACLLLLWVVGALAQTTSSNAGFEELLVELHLNGRPLEKDIWVLRDRHGAWFLPHDMLASENVRTSDVTPIRVNDIAYFPLASLGTDDLSFNPQRMALTIRLHPDRFLHQVRDARGTGNLKGQSQSRGAFLNYDLLLDHSGGNFGGSLFTELGSAVGGGVAVASVLAIERIGYRDRLRLDSSFTQDFPDQITTLRLGDSITRASTILGRPLRFGGLQWGTNFSTRPDMVTMPVATLSGQAALPSTIDLYINDVFQTRSSVPPGPFSIISAPLFSGDGEVLLKVTDITGQQQLVSQRFYASSTLLAPGLTDYSMELGALRRHYGLRSNDYGDLLVAGSWRHGVSSTFTAEAAASAQQNGTVGVEGGATAAFTGLGSGMLALGMSQADAGTGVQIAAGLERRTRTHSFSVRTQFASANFRQAGIDASQTLRRLVSLFYGYRIDRLGSVSLSYTRQQRADKEPVTVATASFTPRQTPLGNFTVSLVQSRAERSDTSINLFWSMSLDRHTSLSAYHAHPTERPAQSNLQIQRNLPSGEGWGYRVQAGNHAPDQAAVFGQNSLAAVRLEAASLNDQTSVRAGISGGIAMLDGQVFASRRIDNSYGLVRLPGFDNVRIYVDNQLAGRTNAEGYALLPRLYPYQKNNVSLEHLDLPLDARLDKLRIYPIPAWRSGITIDFPVKLAAAATMDLITEQGKPVPAGATVTLQASDAQGDETFAVGNDGMLYVAGLRKDNVLRARWATGECEARVRYVPEKGTVPHLGKQLCEHKGGN